MYRGGVCDTEREGTRICFILSDGAPELFFTFMRGDEILYHGQKRGLEKICDGSSHIDGPSSSLKNDRAQRINKTNCFSLWKGYQKRRPPIFCPLIMPDLHQAIKDVLMGNSHFGRN